MSIAIVAWSRPPWARIVVFAATWWMALFSLGLDDAGSVPEVGPVDAWASSVAPSGVPEDLGGHRKRVLTSPHCWAHQK